MSNAHVMTGNVLPWLQAEAQDARFRKIQWRTLLTVLVLTLLMRFLPVPELPKLDEPIPAAPIQLTMVEPKPVVPPPPPVAKPVETVKTQAPPVVAPTTAPPAKIVPKVAPSDHPGGGSQGGPPVPSARDRAMAAAGLGDLSKDFAELKNASAAKAVTGLPQMTTPPNPKYNSDLNGGTDSGAGSERSLITAKSGQSSGGVNTAEFSKGFGGGGLAGRGTTQVLGYAGGGGGGGGTGKGNGRGNGVGNGSGNGSGNGIGDGVGSGSGSGSGSGGGARSREEIEKVFDQNKGAIYAIYQRALRENPGLHGKLVLRITIEPSGEVSACEVVSSELNDPDLEHRLAQRVMLFHFEAKAVPKLTTTKPIDFVPPN